MASSNCFGCGKTLTSTSDKKRRRCLSSPSLQGVLDTLSSAVSEFCNEVDSSKLKTGYICRVCVVLIEKYLQIKKQITSNLQGAIPVMPKNSTELAVTVRQPSIPSTSAASPVLQQSPSKSPALTVSICVWHSHDTGISSAYLYIIGKNILSIEAQALFCYTD